VWKYFWPVNVFLCLLLDSVFQCLLYVLNYSVKFSCGRNQTLSGYHYPTTPYIQTSHKYLISLKLVFKHQSSSFMLYSPPFSNFSTIFVYHDEKFCSAIHSYINVGLKIQNYALFTWKLRKICYIYSENVVLLKNELLWGNKIGRLLENY
jgi:hypothetical protein